jgi:hypothetical protein
MQLFAGKIERYDVHGRSTEDSRTETLQFKFNYQYVADFTAICKQEQLRSIRQAAGNDCTSSPEHYVNA